MIFLPGSLARHQMCYILGDFFAESASGMFHPVLDFVRLVGEVASRGEDDVAERLAHVGPVQVDWRQPLGLNMSDQV